MSEIYYTTQIERATCGVVAWSQAPGYPALLAVALSPNAVGIYTQEGRPLDSSKEALITNVRSTECGRMAWHPLLPLLAIGWKDGGISFWNAEERRLEEDSKTHRRPICSLLWSANGERLVSADDRGKLSFWRTDHHMRPLHVSSLEDSQGGPVRVAVMGPSLAPATAGAATPAAVVFYGVGAGGGTALKWANDQGQQGVVKEMQEDAVALLYYAEKDLLLVVSASCMLSLLRRVDAHQPWVAESEMKLTTGSGEAAHQLLVCWAAQHTLASASERDCVVRMYNFNTEDNFVLQVDAQEGGSARSNIVSLASDPRYGLLAAGTADGRVSVFKHQPPSGQEVDLDLDLAKFWDAQPPFSVNSRPLSMQWGPSPRLMCVTSQGAAGAGSAVHVCRKMLLQQCCRDGAVVAQVGVDRVVFEHLGSPGAPAKLQLHMQLLGLDYSEGNLLAFDGLRAALYSAQSHSSELVRTAEFEMPTRAAAIGNDSIYRSADNRVDVCNLAGVVKQTLPLDNAPGGPVAMSCNGRFLAVITAAHVARVYKVAGREAKPHMGPGLLLPGALGGGGVKVDVLRVNSSGTMIAALCSSKEQAQEGLLYVHSFENTTTLTYDFAKDNRLPQTLAWDTVETKLLAVQTQSVARADDILGSSSEATEVALFFASPDHGMLLQEYQPIEPEGKGLIAIQAPHLLLSRSSHGARTESHSTVARVPMQGFAGLQDGDDNTKSALLDFSYHLATENKEEAFRAVKAIKNPAVWENMAHLCIKNKRLDVAEHCLGNMQHVRGARAVREAKGIDQADARVATVAVHLGMMDDALKLFAASDRFDLLGRLYQASGHWDKALEVAEKHDRIHLKTTHYAYAQFLEKTGDFRGAAKHYEQSGCGAVEVTRMLFKAQRFDDLEAFVARQADNKQLSTWWGRYLESQGEIQQALACYKRSKDVLSVVRIACYTRDFEEAEAQVDALGDPAAAFHLARQYEAQGRIPDAIRYFAQAKRYSHGVRLAKAHGLDGDLMNLALKSTPAVMVHAAEYLDEKGAHEKAAMLYMKGGKLSKAVDMCFAAQLFDVLGQIADDLSGGVDTPLYLRCAEFFMQNGHFDKAVKMTIAAGQYTHALELAVQYEVPITEEMAEAMTPAKDAMPAPERNVVLQQIAKVAKRQGAWQLAAKKYTQAGEKVKAMKSLLRSGDREKVIFFTGVSRNKEVYLMAANYLQTLDWHSDPDLMKSIITFYTKAQAVDSLALFYESCAQIEVDEYRDYEKALQALREVVRHLSKSTSEDAMARIPLVQRQIATTEAFVGARSLIASDPEQALHMCQQLLVALPDDGQDIHRGIRLGDVYALMVEYWYAQRNANEAYQLIQQMRMRGVLTAPYLDLRMTEDIHKAVGAPMPVEAPATAAVDGAAFQGSYAAQQQLQLQQQMQDGYVDDEEAIEEEW